MLDLVPYISSHQGISLKELAEDFGVPESEITSDLNALWMCGDNRFDLIDLEFESGFVSIRNADTINIVRSLSSQEIVALLLGLDLVAKEIPATRDDLHETINSLKSKLGRGLERVVDATPTSSSIYRPLIQSALEQNLKVEIDYYNATEDRVTTRTIAPLDIYRSDGRDFLQAFCELAGSQRTFRLDRIRSAQLLTEYSDKRVSAVTTTKSHAAKVAIRSNFRKAHELLGISGPEAQETVAIETFSPAWLTRTVIAAGGAMVLLEPEDTRGEIVGRAKAALKLYGADPDSHI